VFIELVDSLRCVRDHELTWLVAAADEMRGRDIVRGMLGCPVCRVEYPIVDGVADFGEPPRVRAAPASASDAGALALRAAALLDLTSPGGFAVLAGEWSVAAPTVADIVDGVHILALDPVPGLASGGQLSLATAAADVPIRPLTSRGIALDGAHVTPRHLAAAVAALRPRARLVVPTSVPVPDGIALLARDERHWVGEKEPAPGPVVQLVRAGGA
jgi:uncharacterized protein YbaR (Trm112 family)